MTKWNLEFLLLGRLMFLHYLHHPQLGTKGWGFMTMLFACKTGPLSEALAPTGKVHSFLVVISVLFPHCSSSGYRDPPWL